MCKTDCCLAPGIEEFLEDLSPDDAIRLTALGFRQGTPTNGIFQSFDVGNQQLVWDQVDGFGDDTVTLDVCKVRAIAHQPPIS